MDITASQFAQIFPQCRPDAATWVAALRPAIPAGDLVTSRRLAAFLGVTGAETGEYTTLSESMNYSVEGLLKEFGRHRISEVDARRLGRTATRPADQVAIANLLYGGEWGRVNLGNIGPGAGWKWRGGGAIQITGESNYRLAASLIGTTAEELVVAVRQPGPALLASAKWWKAKGCNDLVAPSGELVSESLCRRVNGGLKGLEKRREVAARALRVLSTSGSATPPPAAARPALSGTDLLNEASAIASREGIPFSKALARLQGGRS